MIEKQTGPQTGLLEPTWITSDDQENAGMGPPRGVQYMHWVMRKCIMVKVGGEMKYT